MLDFENYESPPTPTPPTEPTTDRSVLDPFSPLFNIDEPYILNPVGEQKKALKVSDGGG